MGEKDKETIEKLKEVKINEKLYPNLYRWKVFVEK